MKNLVQVITSSKLIKPVDIHNFLINKHGINSQVILNNGHPVIRVVNHFSLFTIIKDIRNKYDFKIYHKKGKNEYLIQIYL